MEDNYKIRVGITHGDINGVGYEVILKTFSDPTMLELCTPIIYGSPKVAAYHRKAMDIQTNFSIVNSADDAQPDKLSIVNCTEDELKVELSKPTPEAGKAALDALESATRARVLSNCIRDVSIKYTVAWALLQQWKTEARTVTSRLTQRSWFQKV